MKKLLLLLIILTVFFSCTNKTASNPPTLNITSAKWITTTDHRFGFVEVILSGYSNTDSVTVENYGDGLISNMKLPMDANHRFYNDTIPISFTADTIGAGYFTKSTIVLAYNNSQIFADTLYSGKLHY